MASSLPSQDARKRARGNRRAMVRYRCAPATAGKLYLGDDHEEYQRAWIINVSRTGVGLILPRHVPQETFIVIRLRGHHDRSRLFELPAHVTHATLVNRSDWLVGCDLINELSDEELDLLL
jgi:hypothetical protein